MFNDKIKLALILILIFSLSGILGMWNMELEKSINTLTSTKSEIENVNKSISEINEKIADIEKQQRLIDQDLLIMEEKVNGKYGN